MWLVIVVGTLIISACADTSGGDVKQMENEAKSALEIRDKLLSDRRKQGFVTPPPLSDGLHKQMQQFALSPDGNRLALLVEGRPWNEVIVFDWRTGKVQIYTYPTREYKISSPEFSPDGNLLAIVLNTNGRSTSSKFAGVSEIVVFNMQGGVALHLNDPNSIYKLPSFSYDGKKLLFGKGIPAGTFGSTANPTKYTKIKLSWLPFEVELSSRQQTKLLSISGNRAWGSLLQLYYDPNDKGFIFYHASYPQKPAKSARPGLMYWSPDYDNRKNVHDYPGMYRSKIGETVTLPLEYYRPSYLSYDPTRFEDITASGYKIITHYVRSEEYDFEKFSYPIKPTIRNVDIYHGAKKISLTDIQTGRLLLKKIPDTGNVIQEGGLSLKKISDTGNVIAFRSYESLSGVPDRIFAIANLETATLYEFFGKDFITLNVEPILIGGENANSK